MKGLPIADGLVLPLDAITERLGFLGQSGGGKTYGASKLAELMLAAGAQIVALDPVGPWWGLRTSADGKRPGFPIHVFGGIHGDLPLTPEAGSIVADVIVDKGISAVLDVSDFTIGQMQKFVAAFAERFFDRKKRSPSPVHLFLEEAHTFLPQQLPPEPAAAIMLHRVERIVRVGRNYGIGSSQISQMPQSVRKQTLNQIACLFAFGTLGKHERKAIEEWFDQHGGADLAKELPALATGDCYAVSPRWLRLTKCVHVARKVTFDSSETPKFGAKRTEPKVLASVDVKALRESMSAVVAEAEKDDPRALRQRIAQLEAELRAKSKSAPVPPPAPPKRVEVPVIGPAIVARIESAAKRLEDASVGGTKAADAVRVALAKWSVRRVDQPVRALAVPASASRNGRAVAVAIETLAEGEKPYSGEVRMLSALRTYGALTREQLSLVGRVSGGSFRQYLARLIRFGFVILVGGKVSLTERGVVHAQAGERPATIEALIGEWKREARLYSGECRMLDALLGSSAGLSAADLSEAAKVSGGSFRQYAARLKRLGLLTVEGSTYALAEMPIEEAR